MKSKKTLSELSHNPEAWTEEDIADIKGLTNSLIELKKSVAPYETNRATIKSDKNISLKYYQEYTITTGIIETFISSDKVSYKDLIQSIHDNTSNTLYYNLSVLDIKIALKKMIRLGYIIALDLENIYNPNFSITEIGLEHNRQQTLQNLAATNFTNYQTFKLSKKAERMNIIMLIVTIISVIVAICSIYVTIQVSS